MDLDADFIEFEVAVEADKQSTSTSDEQSSEQTKSKADRKQSKYARSYSVISVLTYDAPWADLVNLPLYQSVVQQQQQQQQKMSSDKHGNSNQQMKRAKTTVEPIPTAIELLNAEVLAFSQYVSPTETERKARAGAILRLVQVLNQCYESVGGVQFFDMENPNTSNRPILHVFGSCESDLFLPHSDIDTVLIMPSISNSNKGDNVQQNMMTRTVSPMEMRRLAKLLVRAGVTDPKDVSVLDRARIPIIKYKDQITNYEVDVSFNASTGVRGSQFMQNVMSNMPAVKPLTVLLKCFLRMRGIHKVYSGGLGSYSIMCMVISFLSIHPLVQGGLIDPMQNLGVLLMDFFELYGCNFNYETVGISLVKKNAEDGKVPQLHCSYFEKQMRGWLRPDRPGMLSIEDPQELDNDVAKGSFQFHLVKQAFEHSFAILKVAIEEYERLPAVRSLQWTSDLKLPSILGSIVTLDDDLMLHRYYIHNVSTTSI